MSTSRACNCVEIFLTVSGARRNGVREQYRAVVGAQSESASVATATPCCTEAGLQQHGELRFIFWLDCGQQVAVQDATPVGALDDQSAPRGQRCDCGQREYAITEMVRCMDVNAGRHVGRVALETRAWRAARAFAPTSASRFRSGAGADRLWFLLVVSALALAVTPFFASRLGGGQLLFDGRTVGLGHAA